MLVIETFNCNITDIPTRLSTVFEKHKTCRYINHTIVPYITSIKKEYEVWHKTNTYDVYTVNAQVSVIFERD